MIIIIIIIITIIIISIFILVDCEGRSYLLPLIILVYLMYSYRNESGTNCSVFKVIYNKYIHVIFKKLIFEKWVTG